ncbi:MFS transporter [Glaciihabitans sp. dw_435]|uniref:MFS transporter n=1 Tax=Glaciihabitans sp. dw_435 TaxID=2720081 RepID=UPI001BD62E6B|nr:MFS transporter [Glaciihabitans sp. dw_435]
MLYRRILYRGQFVAAVLLPTWVLIGRGVIANGVGWEFLVYVVACPFLSIAMLAVGGLISARTSVRRTRTVSRYDAGLLTVWYLAIISYGLWAYTALAVLVVVLSVVGFWLAAWQLFTETRSRFRGLMDGFEQAARLPGQPGYGGPVGGGETRDGEAPRVVIINPDDPGPTR